MDDNFNTSFNEEGEKPRFIYKKNPLIEHSFQIFEYFEHKGNYEPIGDYTLIDTNEDLEITDKKVSNLITIMNGRKRLIDFTNLTNERVLFNIIPRDEDSTQQKVVFRTYNGEGVSKENAILTIEKGVFHERE
jgi:hypothetical protein